ncbi:MAG: cell division protein FtsL [Proteobacteria bacterium]|nr:MAG: cell division protein FtsL [Pseudomonadota bacterium]
MSRFARVAMALLIGAVLGSALGVIYAKHQTRKLFVELQGVQKSRDDLQIDWGRLQLEQATWATHGRIESVARERLEMRIPTPDHVVIVKR